MLKGSSGNDLLSDLQADIRWKTISIIIIASESRQQAGVNALERDLSGYVRTPFPIAHLLAQVKDSLVPVARVETG